MVYRKDKYTFARQALIADFVRNYGAHAANSKGIEEPKLKMFMGVNDKPIPEGALVCPMLIPNAMEWYMGWYRGKNDKGEDLVESIETHAVRAFKNTGFYYTDDMEFVNRQKYHWSDYMWYINKTINEKYMKLDSACFKPIECVFNEDSFTVPLIDKHSGKCVKKTYDGLRYVTDKQIKLHMEETRENR